MTDVRNLAGTSVRGWILSKILGAGADGIVYEASNATRQVAIKIFFPSSISKNGPAEARERLELQLALIGRERHPNLVEIYEGGEVKELDTLYLAMELVDGTSLDKLLGKIPDKYIAPLARQLAAAAQYLESLDLVHRDIKPANIVISKDYEKLTLLDLGIIYEMADDVDDPRISGQEFVATLRYSPPEFVWRTESGRDEQAWRAVTFYQIGATLHDVIMKKPLFHGHDIPRARLYDCVKGHTPKIDSTECERWLILTVQACLLKDWRQRLELVSWSSFEGPNDTMAFDVSQQERGLRLRQMRKEESRLAKERKQMAIPAQSRTHELWELKNRLFVEVSAYLQDSNIFPRFSGLESKISDSDYICEYSFEVDSAKDFESALKVSIKVGVDPIISILTKLSFSSTSEGRDKLVNATWSEAFSVETAFSNCRQALLEAADLLISK